MRSVNKDFSKKLIAVQGDLTEPNLGLSENDRSIMIENVNIVFHSAATVKFDEPLKYDLLTRVFLLLFYQKNIL